MEPGQLLQDHGERGTHRLSFWTRNFREAQDALDTKWTLSKKGSFSADQ